MKTYEIDGSRFSTLEGFYEEFTAQVIPGVNWGKNLDALNDILYGGFGTPEDGFTLRWKDSAVSREKLGTKFDAIIEIIADHSDVSLKLE